MLHDFTYYNPTKIYFGKDAMQNLSAELSDYGKNILLLYGKPKLHLRVSLALKTSQKSRVFQ